MTMPLINIVLWNLIHGVLKMSKVFLSSDWHLGHSNVLRFRPQFSSVEEHNETILENACLHVSKRDVLILLGDIAFDKHWLQRIAGIKALKKILILGNHDTERVHLSQVVSVYDQVHSLWSKRNCLISHAPIHEQELRSYKYNIHGHSHDRIINDSRYLNVCVEQTDYKPISWQDLMRNRE